MIHLFALALAFVAAFLRGGRLAQVRSLRLRLGWLVLLSLALQVAVVYAPPLQAGGRYQLPAILIVLSYLMLVAAVAPNLQVPGMKALGIGLLLNFVVIVANGGFMPVSPEVASQLGLLPPGIDVELGARLARSKDILLAPDQTALWVLSDIFSTSLYLPVKTVFSLGDLVSAVGLFQVIQRAMLPVKKAVEAQGERLGGLAS